MQKNITNPVYRNFSKCLKKNWHQTQQRRYGGPKKSRGTTCNYNHENRSQKMYTFEREVFGSMRLAVWNWI